MKPADEARIAARLAKLMAMICVRNTLMFPFQGIGTKISSLALASVAFEWLLLCKAGDTVNETTVDHALIRGLVTAGPDASRSCLGLETSVG